MDKKGKKQLMIKFLSVLASFGLWLYVNYVANPEQTIQKTIPVKFVNADALAQSGLTLSPNQNPTVTLSITGPSTEVYLIKTDQILVEADLSKYVVKKGKNSVPVEIKDYPSNISIERNGMLTVEVDLDSLVQKTVPIKVNLQGKPESGYSMLQYIVKPTDMVVYGAASYVNNVDSVVASGDIQNSSNDLVLTLPLQAVDASGRPIKEVNLQSNNAEVTIPIKKAKTVSINVKQTGRLINSIVLKSIVPLQDKVDIAGDESALAGISSIDTEPIDLSSLTTSQVIDVRLSPPKGTVFVNSSGTIQVRITLDRLIQKNLTVPIVIKNLQPGFQATADITSESLVISGAQTNLDQLKPEDITCIVDLNSLTNEGEYTIPINLTLPSGVKKVSSNPDSVKITIKKISGPAPGTNGPVTSTN